MSDMTPRTKMIASLKIEGPRCMLWKLKDQMKIEPKYKDQKDVFAINHIMLLDL